MEVDGTGQALVTFLVLKHDQAQASPVRDDRSGRPYTSGSCYALFGIFAMASFIPCFISSRDKSLV